MANKVIITKSKLNALGTNMKQTHGLDHNPTIDEMTTLALISTGGSGGGNESNGGIEIPSVSNVKVDKDGILTWNAPSISGLTDYELEYIVEVNGIITKTTYLSLNIWDNLITGDNIINITVIVTFNDGVKITSIPFTKVETITLSPATLIEGMSNASAVAINGNVYHFGGYGLSGRTNLIQCYKPNVPSNAPMNAKLIDAMNSSYAVAINNKAYIFGGFGSKAHTEIQCYDPSTDTITTMNSTINTCLSASAVAINGKAYIFGGQDSNYLQQKTIQCYDPSTDTITTMEATLPEGMSNASAVAINGKAYIFGGVHYSIFKKILCYDPSTDTITTMEATLRSVMQDTSAVAINNKAYIFGGFGDALYYNYIQCYDPSTDTITTMGLTLTEKMSCTSAVAIGNKAYVLGGKNASSRFDYIHILAT